LRRRSQLSLIPCGSG